MQKNLTQAEFLASRMPHLILEARKLASHLSMGLHGRKKAGMGEEFWQYRNLNEGEDFRRVDWRRSARDNHLSVRDRELEVAHKLCLIPDLSSSMQYGTPLKADLSVIFTLALAEILVEGGEKVMLSHLTKPLSNRHIMMELAEVITRHTVELATMPILPANAEPIYMTDGFIEIANLENLLKSSKTKGHLLIINAFEEEVYPFKGRVIFEEGEEKLHLDVGKAESLKLGYLEKLSNHRHAMRALCKQYGWSINFYVNDKPAAPFLLSFLLQLQQRRG